MIKAFRRTAAHQLVQGKWRRNSPSSRDANRRLLLSFSASSSPTSPPPPERVVGALKNYRTSVSAPCSQAESTDNSSNKPNLLFKVGAPFVLFCILSAWTVSNALDGRIKEMETSKGKVSKSLRQVALEAEHEDMMDRLNQIVKQDFDNTKRIKRPHEILEERRLEREKRNAWHRRLYRSVFGDSDSEST